MVHMHIDLNPHMEACTIIHALVHINRHMNTWARSSTNSHALLFKTNSKNNRNKTISPSLGPEGSTHFHGYTPKTTS